MAKLKLVFLVLVSVTISLSACRKCVECKAVKKTDPSITKSTQIYCDGSETRRDAFTSTYPIVLTDADTAQYRVECKDLD